jgi:hypothetical protein
MTTTNGQPTRTTLVATYESRGEQREIHAVRVPDENSIQVIDVLASPRPEDGDLDERHIDGGLSDLLQAEAIAADYTALAGRIGRCPMDGLWW